MKLVFLYGHAAAGKLTVGRELARRTGMPLFHNHLVVDAVAALFPFGTEPFRRLRESWWLEAFEAAAAAGQSLIFTFAPEPTVSLDFPVRVCEVVERAGGAVTFVALHVSPGEQEQRIAAPSRSEHGKLRSLDLLRELRADFESSLAEMPAPAIAIDTDVIEPDEAARRIAEALAL